MAIGAVVIADYTGIASPGLSEPPMRGRSSAESGDDITVLWENGELTVFDSTLLRQLLNEPPTASALYGKYVQVTGWPTAPDGAPKSPGTSGLVVDVIAHGEFGADDPDQVDLVVATENGEQHIMLTDVYDFDAGEIKSNAPFQVEDGRRKV